MGDEGLEPHKHSSGNPKKRNRGGAKSGAPDDSDAILAAQADPRLLWLIDAWPTLPEDTRDTIARLAGVSADDPDGMTAAPHGKGVSR